MSEQNALAAGPARRAPGNRKPLRSLWLPVVVAVFLLIFARQNPFYESVALAAIVASLLGQGFNIVAGYGGWLAFGNQLFFGLGAYTVELGVAHHMYVPLLGLVIAIVFSGLVAYALGRVLSRLGGMLFALSTFALSLIMQGVVVITAWAGGPVGLQEPLATSTSVVDLAFGNYQMVIIGCALIVLVAFGTAVMRMSKFGQRLVAIRDDRVAAESCGVATAHVRAIAWALSAGVTAVAGVFFAQYALYISPEGSFGFQAGIQVVVPAIVGGLGTVGGPVVGSLVVLAGGLLNQFSHPGGITGINYFLYAIVLIIAVRLVPGGIVGAGTRLVTVVSRWLHRRKVPTAPHTSADLPPGTGASAPAEPPPAADATDADVAEDAYRPSPQDTPVLTIAEVSKSFGGVRALADVSIDVLPGEVIGLVGPNGSGKTTLINCVSGTIKPDAGSIMLGGDELKGLSTYRIARLGVARTYQTVRLWRGLTVVENVELRLLREFPRSAARARAMDVLNEVGIQQLADVTPEQLSLAEQRKVELARAVADDAQVILLDEVMAGLTKGEGQAAGELVKRLRGSRGITFVIVEHVMATLLPLVDRLVVMDQGAVLTIGPPDEVMRSEAAVEAYFGAI